MNVSLGESINTLLKGAATVTAICNDRSYGFEAPQTRTAPYNTMQEVVSVPEETHDDCQGLDGTTIQFNCYAKTPKQAIQLRSAIRALLVAQGAIAGVVVSRPDERMFKETSVELWNAQLDLLFWHNPTT